MKAEIMDLKRVGIPNNFLLIVSGGSGTKSLGLLSIR